MLPHPLWKGEYVNRVEVTHRIPEDNIDKVALAIIKTIRFNFDWMSGYSFMKPSYDVVLNRCVFLETIAGVPGSCAAMIRHLHSLRRFQRDHGWIHTLLEEAENERMHLMTFLKMRRPGFFMRSLVWISQGVFFNFFFASYLMYPKFCHRLVGYLEEEAVVTYSKILHMIDDGTLGEWKTAPAPDTAIKYWRMPANSTVRDVILLIRADEAHHRLVNHTLGSMTPHSDNPFAPGL